MIFWESCQKGEVLAQRSISTWASSIFLQAKALAILPKTKP